MKKLNKDKIVKIFDDIVSDMGFCCESSVFIGEYQGFVLQISAMTKSEAEEENYYEGTKEEFNCVEED